MTQCEQVLGYIKLHGGISSMMAFKELGITRLSARIHELRKAGYNIVQKRQYYRETDGTAKHFDVYMLGGKG